MISYLGKQGVECWILKFNFVDLQEGLALCAQMFIFFLIELSPVYFPHA